MDALKVRYFIVKREFFMREVIKRVIMILKDFFIAIIDILFILNVTIFKKNFMAGIYTILYLTDLKPKNTTTMEKNKVFGNTKRLRDWNILEILHQKNKL